jgi:hypothetical protein
MKHKISKDIIDNFFKIISSDDEQIEIQNAERYISKD